MKAIFTVLMVSGLCVLSSSSSLASSLGDQLSKSSELTLESGDLIVQGIPVLAQFPGDAGTMNGNSSRADRANKICAAYGKVLKSESSIKEDLVQSGTQIFDVNLNKAVNAKNCVMILNLAIPGWKSDSTLASIIQNVEKTDSSVEQTGRVCDPQSVGYIKTQQALNSISESTTRFTKLTCI